MARPLENKDHMRAVVRQYFRVITDGRRYRIEYKRVRRVFFLKWHRWITISAGGEPLTFSNCPDAECRMGNMIEDVLSERNGWKPLGESNT